MNLSIGYLLVIKMHGVLLNIFATGVLITGRPGIGKSELALTLIDRGHQLIADDAPEFYVENGILIGACPPLLQGFINIRNIGTININKIFSFKSCAKSTKVQLAINIDPQGTFSDNIEIKNIKIPQITIKKDVVLIETIVHNFLLKQQGYDADLDLSNKQKQLLQQETS
jgi:HPr kinase/phosphorylase